ncbi:putative CRM domain-containing protein [Senna tora]|uniref:Putative CRM domain-containing protein n=1 Tax=Senna tora TaxID=362788 RepID=A0A834SDR5_9FABA|nr:putative CRM domain-containing protein [Senna tora]
MRSKVERRMQKESGKTLREIRRAKKLKKKLMTEEERLIYNLKRAKKKVALLLQKLKKYELPELPPSRHDPELLTPEQLQAFKKIGFRNKNYVPVGVRGVFGGVVQNMHLHWKFHETVQVCCDNFPKEKIKEMATMLARLSGGIVINIHNVKTIIMFRGRNYRQPKNLIPLNTLTKRKALFKARFEQALESQKLNIKKIEQQLRRMGVNPEDPAAMASIQRVASTFFNAIDKKEGSPYVFHEVSVKEPDEEDAADKEYEAEEAKEQEELGRIRLEVQGVRGKQAEEWNEEEKEKEIKCRNRNKTMTPLGSDGNIYEFIFDGFMLCFKNPESCLSHTKPLITCTNLSLLTNSDSTRLAHLTMMRESLNKDIQSISTTDNTLTRYLRNSTKYFNSTRNRILSTQISSTLKPRKNGKGMRHAWDPR